MARASSFDGRGNRRTYSVHPSTRTCFRLGSSWRNASNGLLRIAECGTRLWTLITCFNANGHRNFGSFAWIIISRAPLISVRWIRSAMPFSSEVYGGENEFSLSLISQIFHILFFRRNKAPWFYETAQHWPSRCDWTAFWWAFSGMHRTRHSYGEEKPK